LRLARSCFPSVWCPLHDDSISEREAFREKPFQLFVAQKAGTIRIDVSETAFWALVTPVGGEIASAD